MTTENPNHDPIQTLRDEATLDGDRKGAASLKKIPLGILKYAALTVLAPTWMLNRFEYSLDFVTVWSVWMLGGMLLLVAMLANGFTPSAMRAHDERMDKASVVVRRSRKLIGGVAFAIVIMLLYGALEFNVGFLHILLAYHVPGAIWDLAATATRKLRGKSNDSVTSELVK